MRPRADLIAAADVLTVAGVARTVERRAGTDARPILRLTGCATRTDAEALRGQDLLAPRSLAAPLEDDEYWPEDLEGCDVVDGDRRVGVVERLLAYPSCELLEVRRDEGGPLLVPMVRDAIRGVDVAARVIEIDLAFLGEA
ncbi:Ribosome maturation factor RimM [Capillimicrobium parvum]|uniref:Ribosome maturation factor RimM n=1 Tax=Capillimicrobium parvum TaxID=2884022 RepID=A0A9E7BZZ9_9ACTN|nr:Ribosome maturation factor RimM [Capillimicrobium parvum]